MIPTKLANTKPEDFVSADTNLRSPGASAVPAAAPVDASGPLDAAGAVDSSRLTDSLHLLAEYVRRDAASAPEHYCFRVDVGHEGE